MEGTRGPQETVALRDMAYVICFGHFPKDDNVATRNQGTTGGAPPVVAEPLAPASDVPESPSQSSTSDDQNPFLDDQNPLSEDQSPIAQESSSGGDQSPLKEEESSPVEAQNVANEDSNSANVSQSSLFSEQSLPGGSDPSRQTPPADVPSPSTQEKGPSSPAPATTPESPLTPTPAPAALPSKVVVEVGSVSRAHAKEVIAEAFNVTHLDLRHLVEDIGKNKEAPSVELVLEEMRTEGLAVEPTADSSSPPTVFLRAVVGNGSRFTSFSSISATRAIQNALTLVVRNMYTDTLLLQIWRAGSSVAVEAQSGPVLDILGRLITSSIRHRKEKAASTSPRHNCENITTTTNGEVDQEDPLACDMDGDVGQGDQVDHSDNTPIINTSIWQDRNQKQLRESTRDKEIKEKGGSKTTNAAEVLLNGHKSDGQETSDDVSVSSEHSPEQVRTSTPRLRSASFQSLELSTVGEDAASLISEKNKKQKGSLRIKATNFRASLRSAFKKGNQNDSVESTGLEMNAADAHSVKSEDTDASSAPNPFDEEEELDKNNPFGNDSSPMQESGNLDANLSVGKSGNEKNKLDRERSKSSLSIASLSKLNMSLHLSVHKATDLFKRVKSKKGKKSFSGTSTPELPRQQLPDDDTSIASFQMDSTPDGDQVDASPASNDHSINGDGSEPQHQDIANTPLVTSYTRKSFRSNFSTRRPLRAFRSLRDKGNTRKQIDMKDGGSEGCDADRYSEEGGGSPEVPLNPDEVQGYLSSIGKGHLKAELLAHVSIPVKTLVGTWEKEDSFPLIAIHDRDENSNPSPKRKKFNKASGGSGSKVNERSGKLKCNGKLKCKLHIRLTLPTPETELTSSSYDTYSVTLRKLVHMQVQALDTLKDYKGTVGAVGDVLLQQLVFFSRVSDPHRTLATWLVLVEVKPLDPGLLLPLLQAIRSHLESGLYLTTQKHQLASSLACWVQKVSKDEFETLHSSFPSSSELLELPRLENYLRCFNVVETCYELRVLFQREMILEELNTITDLLQDALCKHVKTWVEALNKEPLKHGSDTSLSSSLASSEWQEAQRRASMLTKPILDFLTISFHTYQTIFMLELSVNYMYLVMPKMLAAALYLLNPLLDYDVDGANQVPSEAIPTTAHAAWVLCSNLSQINKIGIEIRFPQHLIPQEYRNAFSAALLNWLALSKHLALEEFDTDIQKDEFVAVDDQEGYSQSAVGATDLLKALMRRVCEVRWPGGVGPGGKTLNKIGQQVLDLASQYTNKVTHAYSTRGGYTDRISSEVCVVVRNVEHMCDKVRNHLLHLAGLADTEDTARQLREDTNLLQEHLDYTAEYLLQRCLPRLEQILTQGVDQGNSEFVVKSLQEIMQPVEDRLYFAEPLLHQLWLRLFHHATSLMVNFIQGDLREDLRHLRRVLADTYDFLIDQEGVGLNLPEDVTKEFEACQAKLKILGATTPELVSQFYHERHQEQLREGASTTRALIVNVAFTEAGLRVYVVQGPGMQPGGVLVKVRVEPHQWFPTSEPRKTHLVKSDPAVFNETFEFPGVVEDHREGEQGGMLTLQIRTPRLLGNSIVHYEALLPLADLPHVPHAEVHRIQHSRLPLTRPWKLTSYKPLEALKTRALDKTAVDFLKALSERWEPHESSVQIQDSQKLRATFARAGSIRNSLKGTRKPSHKNAIKKTATQDS